MPIYSKSPRNAPRNGGATENPTPARLKAVLRLALGAGIITAAVVVAVPAARVVAPPMPISTAYMRFDGFIALPATAGWNWLSVFDYMTVEGRDLYVASIQPGTVFKLPLRSGPLPNTSEIESLPGPPSAHGVTFDPITHRGFVSRSGANVVDVFDPVTLQVEKQIPVEDDVDAIAFDAANRLVYAVHGDAKRATLIDPVTLQIAGSVQLPGKPEFAVFDPGSRTLYQNLNDTNYLMVIDLARRAPVSQWYLAGCDGPSGMAMDRTQRRLFIACNRNDRLVVYDLDRRNIVASMPVGGGPDVVGYDDELHRIYTTGRSGVMTTVQLMGKDRYKVLSSVVLTFGAHTLAVDQRSHRVYVGYLSLWSKPRLAVFSSF